MALESQPSPSTSWFCVTANGPVCLDSPCVQSCERCFTCRCANQVHKQPLPIPLCHLFLKFRTDRWKRQRNVQGVLGVYVDDLVGGGNLAFQKAVQWLRTELEFGTWDQSRSRFRGREFEYNRKSIKISMSKFVQEMEPVAVPKHVKDDVDAPLEANVSTQSISWRCRSASVVAAARKSTPVVCHWNLAKQVRFSQLS